MSHQPDNIFRPDTGRLAGRGARDKRFSDSSAWRGRRRQPDSNQDQNKFLVLFPDGNEAWLTREQVDVLKHFKDRMFGAENPAADFDQTKLTNLQIRGRLTRVWMGQRRIRHRLPRRLPRSLQTAMVTLRRAGTIRGQRHEKLLRGIAEVLHRGLAGQKFRTPIGPDPSDQASRIGFSAELISFQSEQFSY